MAGKKAWGGRFSTETHKQVEAFTASIDFDRRLAPYDIAGSIAHARMLAKCGILTKAEADAIVGGLEEIREEIARGDFRYDHALEDIHMHVERRLTDKIGEVASVTFAGTLPVNLTLGAVIAPLYYAQEINAAAALEAYQSPPIDIEARNEARLKAMGIEGLRVRT